MQRELQVFRHCSMKSYLAWRSAVNKKLAVRDAELRGRGKARQLLLEPVSTPVPHQITFSCEYRAYGPGNHVQSQQRRHQEGHQNEDTGLSCKCTPQQVLWLSAGRSLDHRGQRLASYATVGPTAEWLLRVVGSPKTKYTHHMFRCPSCRRVVRCPVYHNTITFSAVECPFYFFKRLNKYKSPDGSRLIQPVDVAVANNSPPLLLTIVGNERLLFAMVQR